MGPAGFWMSAAALARLPSVSLLCSSRRSAWTPTPACLQRAPVPPRKESYEHPVGPGLGRGPARGRARTVPAGDLRPVLPLDRRAASGRDRLRHAGARRRACTDRPHSDGPAPAARPWATADPPRRDQGAGSEVSRIYPARRPGHRPGTNSRFEDVLARTRFGVPQQLFVPGIPDLLRDSESVLSGYLSLSSSAPHLFGDRLDDFAGEVRALLANRSAEGIFWDWPGDTEVIMARKPG